MDEKFEKWFTKELIERFKCGLTPDEFGERMYLAGCAAQAKADREAVGNLKTVRYNFYANEFGDAYLKSGVEAALASASIKE